VIGSGQHRLIGESTPSFQSGRVALHARSETRHRFSKNDPLLSPLKSETNYGFIVDVVSRFAGGLYHHDTVEAVCWVKCDLLLCRDKDQRRRATPDSPKQMKMGYCQTSRETSPTTTLRYQRDMQPYSQDPARACDRQVDVPLNGPSGGYERIPVST
jgi:hypothetical protein